MNNLTQITNFLKYLSLHGVSPKSLKYYKSDLVNFLNWSGNRKVTATLIQEYISSARLITPTSTLNRRISTLRSYGNFMGFKKTTKTWQDGILSKFEHKQKFHNFLNKLFFSRPNWYRKYHSYPLANYIHVAILVLFTSISGYAFYDQVFRNASNSSAYPTALTRPNRYLSFQGRLTDNLGNPKTVATDIVFKLYAVSSGGTALWNSGTCSITPDQDGIFSTLLGSSCGAEIDASVFSENASIWLGATMGADAEATPRVQIATVAYALNAETLQGYPAGTGTSTIPYINSSGSLVLANASPTIQSTSGTFAVEGVAMTITTPNTSDGIITVNPDGVGTLNLTFEGAAAGVSANGFVNATNANITSGALYGGTVASAATGYNFIDFQSGVSPTSKFSVSATGAITTASGLTIGTTSLSETTAANDSGAYLIGTFDEFSNSASANVQDVLDDLDAAIAANGSGDITAVGSMTSGDVFADATADDDWLGLGAAAGRIEFDDQTTDEVNILNANVGIGTSAPEEKLHIYGTGTATTLGQLDTNLRLQSNTVTAGAGNEISFRGINTAAENTGTYAAISAPLSGNGVTGSKGYISFSTKTLQTDTALSERMRITEDGNVGIGTTGPDAKLDSLATTEQLRLTYADGTVYSAHTVDSSGNLTIDNTGTKTIIADDLEITGGNIVSATTFDLTLTATGNLTSNANTTIGNANTDTVTINAGTSGTGIAFGDASFASCTALETVAGVLTCGADAGGNTAWSDISVPSGNLSLAMDMDTTTFGWTSTGDLNAWTMNMLNNGGSATTQNAMVINNAVAGSFTDVATENLLLLQQLDTTAAGTTVLTNALKIDSAANSGMTNGINITNSAGDMTTGINIVDTAGGTLTTGIALSGTFTTGIDTGGSIIANIGNAGTDFNSNGGLTLAENLVIQGTTGLTFNTGVGGDITFANGEKIDNDTDDVIKLTATTTETSNNLKVSGNQILNSAGTASVLFSATPTTTANTLSASSWLVENAYNVGLAALMVNQTKAGDLFSASLSGTPKFTVTNSGVVKSDVIGTAKANLDIFELTNHVNAADMDATRTSILFNQWYYDAVTPAIADAGRLTVGTETDWTSTASTQDSFLSFDTALDGTLAEKMRISSAGYVGIGTTGPDRKLDILDASSPQLRLTQADGTVYSDFQMDSNGDLIIGVDGVTSQLVLDNGGNVGIGTTTPNKLLSVWGGDGSIMDPTDLGSESLTNGALNAGVDWSVNIVDCVIDLGVVTCTFNNGTASTLTQASGNLAVAGVGSRWYKFVYTVSGVSGSPTASITTAFASSSTSLTISNGTQTTYFQSAASPGDFVITTTLTAGQAFTLDDLSLKEVQGGDLALGGILTGGGTTGLKVLANGNVGIGTTAPTNLLDITYNDTTNTAFHLGTTTNNGGYMLSVNDSNLILSGGAEFVGSAWTARNTTTSFINMTTGDINFYGDTGLTDNTTFTPTLLMSLDGATGALGINDASPTEATLVVGNAGAGSIFLTLTTTGTTNNVVCWDNSGATLLYDCDAGPFTDYAEIYPTKSDVDYGDIVTTSLETTNTMYSKSDKDGNVISTETLKIAKLTKTASPSENIIGIVSQNWGDFTSTGQNSIQEEDHPLPVALSGRVPVKISSTSTAIKIGDPITSSSDLGRGIKATQSGKIVGTALQDWDPTNPTDTILVFVNNSYYNPDLAINNSGDVTLNGTTLADYTVTTPTGITSKIGAFAEASIAKLKAGIGSFRQVETNLISPVANADLIIDLQPDDSQPASKLAIKGENNEEVAVIDGQGNAEFDGTVESNELIVNSNATISGTLYADKIESTKLTEIEKMLKEVESNQTLLTESQNWNTNTATESGQFTDLIANNIQTKDLFVTGQSAVTSLFVSDNFTTKNVNSLTDTLYIQSLAVAPIEIMAGKIKIETNGDVTFLGNVEIAGNIKLNGNFVVASDVVDTVTPPTEIVTGETISNSTAGKAILPAGLTEIKIINSKINTNSLIYITPVTDTQNKVLFVKSKDVGEFKVGFTESIDIDVEFNWWIIELNAI